MAFLVVSCFGVAPIGACGEGGALVVLPSFCPCRGFRGNGIASFYRALAPIGALEERMSCRFTGRLYLSRESQSVRTAGLGNKCGHAVVVARLSIPRTQPPNHFHHVSTLNQRETKQFLPQILERGPERVQYAVIKEKKSVMHGGKNL